MTTTMTHQHFEMIAATLKDMRPAPYTVGFGVWRAIVVQFRLNLNHTNRLFDGERFMRACEYEVTEAERKENGLQTAIALRGTLGHLD